MDFFGSVGFFVKLAAEFLIVLDFNDAGGFRNERRGSARFAN